MNHWAGKKVAFLGDSITDACHVGTTKNYWQFLAEWMQIEPWVYGLNGWRWDGIEEQAKKLFCEHGGETDAVLIFMGTNDFNGGIPPGRWWNIKPEYVNQHGKTVLLPRRHYSRDMETFCGRINIGIEYVKKHFPDQQIILLTPIHRGFAQFSDTNVQPEESFPNELGLYVETYVELLREAADIWSLPLIDLFRISGLLPPCDEYAKYFHDRENDRLHPNASGHERIARSLYYQLSALPSDFKNIRHRL